VQNTHVSYRLHEQVDYRCEFFMAACYMAWQG
jgi:hypothetical protein